MMEKGYECVGYHYGQAYDPFRIRKQRENEKMNEKEIEQKMLKI